MEKKYLIPLTLIYTAVSATATLIGHETFDTNGLIGGQTGGTGFGWDNLNDVQTATVSDWDNVTDTPNVAGNQLITLNNSAKREYNGNVEGAGGGNGPETERAGAYRGVGAVYHSVQMTRTAGADWSGLSSYDFNTERIFFGVPGSQGATKFFGIVETTVGTTLSTLQVVDGQTYTIVSKVDFDNDLLSLWVDPVAGGEGANVPVITRAYTGTNWSTAARLGSGGTAQTAWDDLRIGTTFDDVVVVIPEPQSLALALFGAALLILRKRRG